MIRFIYGRTGSGKSAYVYSLAQESAKSRPVLILVPEREAVTAERDCAALSGAGNIDVVTFSRLCNFIFRKKGGLCENYVAKSAKKIVMYSVLRELAPVLRRFGNVSKTDTVMVDKLLAARSELFRNRIAPADIHSASERLSDKERIAEKFEDLSALFSAYDARIAERWSDPDGAISRATDVCGDFFRGKDVYIDSFFTFTKEQYEMLRVIFSEAENVWVTLAYLPEYDAGQGAFRSLAETDDRLLRLAKSSGAEIGGAKVLARSVRYENEELSFLADNMFSSRDISAEYTEKPGHIRVVNCANAYSEAEAVASDIRRRVIAGERFRDIAVIMREPEDYKGIIDAALEKYDIPYFLSRRADMDERSLVKFIYSAYAAVTRGFRTKDLIEYIKTDNAGISRDECDELENYLIKWNIGGKRFYSDEPWVENPRGYEETRSDDDAERIARLNETRDKVRGPLLKFAGAVKNCRTVREHATVLYDFLTLMNVPKKTAEDAAALRAIGDEARASEQTQLWNVLCACLDQTVAAAGEAPADADEFLLLLRLALSETDIGVIPTSVDEVLVGGAAKIRPLSAKTVYVIGACEGIFPRKADEDGIFSEYEKQLLDDMGIEFSSRLEKNMSDELFYFFSTVCSPSRELVITYAEHNISGEKRSKSGALRRIEAIFPKLEETRFENTPAEDLVCARRPALEYALSSGGTLALALRDRFSGDGEFSARLENASADISADGCRISPDCAEELFGGTMKESYSRIEKYIKCRFSYYCDYELGIADDSPAEFSAVNVGNFLHDVLEATAKYAASASFDDERLDAMIKSAADRYIALVTNRPASELSPRLRHLCDHLCKSAKKFAYRIRDEFRESRFVPMDFELRVGDRGVEPMSIGNDECEVVLSGKIDRVDGMETEDGTLYLRVIDYKKSGKDYDPEKIKLGLDMQMLLYLFSLWENGEKRYGKKIVPAGAIYVETNPALQTAKPGTDGEKPGSVSGFVLESGDDGLDVARAMEPSLAGIYSPVRAGGRSDPKKNLMGKAAMEELKKSVTATVLKYASEMKGGAAQARPIDAKGEDPCKYCKLRPICRISTKGSSKEDEDT